MTRKGVCLLAVFALASFAALAYALDPPHSLTAAGNCSNCHTPHHALGGTLTKVAGNPNLCQSCHVTGGLASARALPNSDQAQPAPGLPAGTAPAGNSHRWDSGPSGHVSPDAANTSTGAVQSGGALTGRYPKTYTLAITAPGDVGTAVFSWTDTLGGSGSGMVTGTEVPLNEGITATFTNGGTSPSFKTGDQWRVYVRTELRLPTTPALAARISEGKIMCSTCHNQHSQANQPFDPTAPAYGGAGTGWTGTGVGRHYQRVANDQAQMCEDCHNARVVTSSTQGSHPVGVPIPGGQFKAPSIVPLDSTGKVRCLTCHRPHFGPAFDGTLRRVANTVTLCTDCHTLADTATPASHLNPTSGVLWPGGQYGSTFPAVTDAAKRGFCTNCHFPHGWPDNDNPSQKFPKLWVERYDVDLTGRSDPDTAERLCFTCHDGSPARTNIRGEFQKGTAPTAPTSDIYRHPVADSEQVALGNSPIRSVECVNCHNPHRATAANRLAGVSGIDLNGNPVGLGTTDPSRDPAQHEVCFKCHGDAYNTSRPSRTNKRLDFRTENTAFHPVAGPGRNQSTNLNNQLRGGLTKTSTIKCTDCHNNEQTANAAGPASNSTASPQGPHGSTNPAIRRAAYWATPLTGPSSFNQNNFALCYLCHDVAKHTTAREWKDGASTNFYDDVNGKDNLHWMHLFDKVGDARPTCKNCHYNVHSNRASAGNTQYRINGVVYDGNLGLPPGVKTRLVSFSPDVTGIGGRPKPEWYLNTATRERRCYLSCHGGTMDGRPYRASQGDDDPLTFTP